MQVRLAEVEQASLMSEQLSDKSSSPALPDDLSLDEHSSYQLLVRDSQVCVSTRSLTPNKTFPTHLSHLCCFTLVTHNCLHGRDIVISNFTLFKKQFIASKGLFFFLRQTLMNRTIIEKPFIPLEYFHFFMLKSKVESILGGFYVIDQHNVVRNCEWGGI